MLVHAYTRLLKVEMAAPARARPRKEIRSAGQPGNSVRKKQKQQQDSTAAVARSLVKAARGMEYVECGQEKSSSELSVMDISLPDSGLHHPVYIL